MSVFVDVHESATTQKMAVEKLGATVKHLKVGDIVDDEKGCAIELKEITDFVGSVRGSKGKPGRIYAQVHNMKINYPHNYVVIYGSFDKVHFNKKIRNFTKPMFFGAMASLSCRMLEREDEPGTYYDKTPVYWVENRSQAITICKSLIKKSGELAKPLDLIKRAKPTNGNFVSCCLQNVPRLGVKRSEDIVEYFNLNKVSKLTALTEAQLQEVPGVGPKQSEAIKMWFS